MKLFYEKYIKLAHIGKGANAHVYKVRHAELGYIRAIKILNEDIESKEERTYQSFLKECKTLLTIGNGAHPNIIRIYGPDLIDNHAIVEMDYVQGNTLDSYIKDKGFLDYDEIKTFIHDIVGALAYTHHDIYKFLMNPDDDDLQQNPKDGKKYVITPEKEAELVKKYGIAHNDLHSNNVMRRDYDGSFVLLDFGLAVQDGECIKSSRKSDGHPEYMAPEKFDSGDITPRSDVYSLGVLIYEILTGRPPFVLDCDSEGKVSYPALSKICNEHHNQTPPAVLPLRKKAFERQIPGAVYERDYPEWLDEIVMKCLAKNPEDRYADAKELLDNINWHISQERQDQSHPLPPPLKPDRVTELDPVIPPDTNNDGRIVNTSGKPSLKDKKNMFLFIVVSCVILMGAVLYYMLSLGKGQRDYIPVQAIVMPQNEYSLNVGDSTYIKPKIIPTNATDTIVNWVSTNPTVVQVLDNDCFKAMKSGSASLKAISKDGKVSTLVSIQVLEKKLNQLDESNQSENVEIELSKDNQPKESAHNKNELNTNEKINSSTDQAVRHNNISIPGNIQDALDMLVDGNISRETRLNSIPEIVKKFFEHGAMIRTVSDSDLILDNENAEDFLRRIVLSRRVSRIIITGTEKQNKITELRIKEIHK